MKGTNISIPSPCNKNWGEMAPVASGRLCTACSQIVIDFTDMTTEEVKKYFLNHNHKNICGNFKSTQIQKDYNSFHQALIKIYNYIDYKINSKALKFAYLFLISGILSLTGCEGAMGKKATDDTADTRTNNVNEEGLKADTSKHSKYNSADSAEAAKLK